jgi:hypothetical protein
LNGRLITILCGEEETRLRVRGPDEAALTLLRLVIPMPEAYANRIPIIFLIEFLSPGIHPQVACEPLVVRQGKRPKETG